MSVDTIALVAIGFMAPILAVGGILAFWVVRKAGTKTPPPKGDGV